MSDFRLHGFETFEGDLALGELGARWRVDDRVPAVIQERGVWIGLLDPQDLRARLEAGQERRAARDVLSPHLHYCFHDTDAVEAAEFARATGAVWMGVLDDGGELIGLIAREDLARPSSSPDAPRARRAGHGQAA